MKSHARETMNNGTMCGHMNVWQGTHIQEPPKEKYWEEFISLYSVFQRTYIHEPHKNTHDESC